MRRIYRSNNSHELLVAAGVLSALTAILLLLGNHFTAGVSIWSQAPIVSAAGFSDGTVGQPMLLSGPISGDTVGPGGLLIGIREYESCSYTDDTRTCTWKEAGRWTPLVIVADVPIANRDYQIGGTLIEIYGADTRHRVRGIPPDARVTAAVQRAPDGSAYAIQIYAGTPAQFQAGWTLGQWVCRGLASIAGLLAIGAIILWRLP